MRALLYHSKNSPDLQYRRKFVNGSGGRIGSFLLRVYFNTFDTFFSTALIISPQIRILKDITIYVTFSYVDNCSIILGFSTKGELKSDTHWDL